MAETMKTYQTITVQNLRKKLRHQGDGYLENYGGWCTFILGRQRKRLFVIDDLSQKPMIFRDVVTNQTLQSDPEGLKKIRRI
jgi:hypothetical protein